MKRNLALLYSFCTALLCAQTSLFQNPVNSAQLQPNQRLHEDLSASYISTTYYLQPAFNTETNLEIQLPTGKKVRASLTKTFRYTNKSTSFAYAIENEPESELVFSRYGNMLSGMYASSEGEKIMFQQTDDKIIAVSMVNEAYINSRDSSMDFLLPAAETHKTNQNICLSQTPACGATTIDVMVVYTSAARLGWGSVAQSNSQIATAITNFNLSLLNSGIPNTTINLVYAGEIDYTESGNISTDLNRLRLPADGFMDDAHTLRNTYGADLCALITATPTNTCGLGYLNTNPSNYSNSAAFSVSLRNCAVSNYTLSHEMGHNMGLNHDWYVNQSNNPCSNMHGYVNQTAVTLGTASSTSQRWRTLMAYNDECADAGINCSRTNRWANPLVNYNGEPTGIAAPNPTPSDEAFGFARFACVVADFMPTANMNTVESVIDNRNELTVYPNPASEEINISTANSEANTFRIINMAGQVVHTGKNKTVNIRHLSPGEYILTVSDTDGAFKGSAKFIVK